MNKKCTMTLSGKHLFMPIQYLEAWLAQVYEAHGIKNPQLCVFCKMVDDMNRIEQ